MEKMTWKQPEIKELDVKETAVGTQYSSTPDAMYQDPNGNLWYSHS